MYTAFDSLKGQHLSGQQVVFNQLLCYLIQLSWHIPLALPFEIAMSGKIFKQLFNTKKGKTKQSANGVTTAPNGEPHNPVNCEAHEPNSSTELADREPLHVDDQDAGAAPPTAGQPPNPANGETLNGGGGIPAGGHVSAQGTQETPAVVSATTASAQSPEGAASVSDKVNASMQPNASSAVVPHNEEENSFIQGPSISHGEEVDGDTSTPAQTAQQKETDNSYEQLPGE